MHAIELTGPDVSHLRRTERPAPSSPGSGRIHVRMKAASLNYMDLAVATGQYPGVRYPVIPLVDGSGEVVAIGPDVWQVAVGDRVAVHSKPRWIAGKGTAQTAMAATRGLSLPGAAVEIAESDAAGVVKAPDFMSYEAIASISGAAGAAWRGLEAGAVGPTTTVVLLGTGGVSIAALQLAKARGARVVITSSSDEKLRRARALGADETINYRAVPDWPAAVRELTGGLGADLVIDAVGGQEFARSIGALRYGGTLYALGFIGGSRADIDVLSIISNGLRVEGTNGASVADVAAVVATMAAHRIEPVIDSTFPVAELAAGYETMRKGGHFGKIAVTLDW